MTLKDCIKPVIDQFIYEGCFGKYLFSERPLQERVGEEYAGAVINIHPANKSIMRRVLTS